MMLYHDLVGLPMRPWPEETLRHVEAFRLSPRYRTIRNQVEAYYRSYLASMQMKALGEMLADTEKRIAVRKEAA